jgi:hypothetical protein
VRDALQNFGRGLVALAFIIAWGSVTPGLRAAEPEMQVDTALLLSVDVSSSVDEHRYQLQMEGIAKALEDQGVIDAITGGPNGAILIGMMTWADKPTFNIPWTRISNKDEARKLAAKVRKLPLQTGEFTCMTRMMRSVNDKVVTQIPAHATRVVVDVSGDGPENCNADEPIDSVRDELVQSGVTVNGLPINEGDPSAPVGEGAYRAPGTGFEGSQLQPTEHVPTTIEQWYRAHVMGGTGAFVIPANGYEDFERAMRQKFVIEISGLVPPARYAANPSVGNRLVAVEGLVEADRSGLVLEVQKLR